MKRRFYAFRIKPDGTRQRLTPMGQRTFGPKLLAWQKARAKRKGWKIIVKRAATTADEMRRQRGVDAMQSGLNNERRIHYSQRRPFRTRAMLDQTYPVYTDCSGMATMIDRAAGFPDPNAQGYNGYGFTGTIRKYGPLKSLGNLLPGDKIVYGTGDGRHVVTVYSQGHTRDPIVYSHGQESGPRLYRHSVQVSVHGSYFTCHGPRTR